MYILINAANRANDSSDIPKACEARDAIEAFVKIRVQLKSYKPSRRSAAPYLII